MRGFVRFLHAIKLCVITPTPSITVNVTQLMDEQLIPLTDLDYLINMCRNLFSKPKTLKVT